MKVLLLGSGGREHALAWKLVQSPLVTTIFIAPGNAGTATLGVNVKLNPNDFPQIANWVKQEGVEMVVVGPEEPLVLGIADYFSKDPDLEKVHLIGPSQAAARLEGSKDFSKQFMIRNGIPTARHFSVTQENIEEGFRFLDAMPAPYVLKADGLAAGKGVVILTDLLAAKHELQAMLNGRFGQAGERVLIESFLQGVEVSVFILTDGESYVLLPEAKDYKRIGEGDQGPNTGGMGAVSPVPFADDIFMEKVKLRIIDPTLKGLKDEGINYRGFLFFGLMNVAGNPYLIEYNCRLGDPETEAILPRISSDLMPLFLQLKNKGLRNQSIAIDSRFAVSIMMVSGGYPGDYVRGYPIKGLDIPSESLVFQAGTISSPNGVITNGGRVLAITSLAISLDQARLRSIALAGQIQFKSNFFRKDIGLDLI